MMGWDSAVNSLALSIGRHEAAYSAASIERRPPLARTSPLSQVESTAALVAEEDKAEKGITRRRLLRGRRRARRRGSPRRSLRAPRPERCGAEHRNRRRRPRRPDLSYRLRQAGVAATLYEGSNRLGGRCWTGRGDFFDGQIYEHGGELIDSGHLELKHLVQELGFPLDHLLQAEANGTDVLGHFDGQPYTAERDEHRPEGDLAAAAQRPVGRRLPDALQLVDVEGPGAGPDVAPRLDQRVRAGWDRVEAGAAPRHRLQHRVRRRDL